jgi:uncharacterized protein (TIGR02231 family)
MPALLRFASGAGFAALAAAAVAQADAPPPVEAPITAVVLYPGSATIVRSVRVTAGATRVAVGGLPAGFAVATLRVEADPGIRVGQVEIREAAHVESPNPVEADLEARIQALKDRGAELDVQAGAADVVKAYLDRLGGDPGEAAGHPRPPLDAKTLSGLIEAIGRGANEALATKQRVAVQKRALEKSAEALQRDLERLHGPVRDTRSVTIHLAAERAGSLRLSYQENGAGWKPGYRVALDSAASTVRLERTALVAQSTGEDWKDVKMTLATSQPRLSPAAPTPQPWLLGYRPPRPPQEGKAAEPALFARGAAAPAARMADRTDADSAPEAPASQTDAAYATEFVLPATATVPADGREISLSLSAQTLAVRQHLQVTPRIDRAATLVAEAERPGGVWPAGEVQVFRDGNYVGAARWGPQASETFRFFFGRDDLVRVTLDRIQGNDASTGVFERRNRRTIADRITLASAHAMPVDIVVLEATPVSTSDEVRVEPTFDPKPTIDAWERRRGVVGWEKTLAPNGTAQISVRYTIEYPKEGTTTGLP